MKAIVVASLLIGCIVLDLSQLMVVTAEDNIHTVDNVVYYIEPQQKYNWSESVKECRTRNMFLVTLNTEEKVNRLRGVLKTVFLDKSQKIPKLYIGANDIDEYRKHIWISNGEALSFTNWEKSEPNNYGNLNERCVHLGFHGNDQWNDINCSRNYGYICEQPKTDYEFAIMSRAMDFA